MKLKRRISILFLLIFIGLLIPISEVSAAYTRSSSASGTYPSPYWLIKVHKIGMGLDYQFGKVFGRVDFTIRAAEDWEEVYVDKVYLWVDTSDTNPQSWSKTYSTSTFNVKYGESAERHCIITPEILTGVGYSNAYSCTIWIRFVCYYDGPFAGPTKTTVYIAHRVLFWSYYSYYGIPASPNLEIFSSPPPNAPVYV